MAQTDQEGSDARNPRRTAKGPGNARGVQRRTALLDATELLLTTSSPEDIGIYQIAEQAGVPPASAYHFFPTKDAAYLALGRRYIEAFWALEREQTDARQLKSWQDYFEIEQDRARRFGNAHPVALKIFYGGYGSPASRKADVRLAAELAERIYPVLDTLFHMPRIPDATRHFQIALAILNAVWALSYEHHGEITDAYFQDALKAHNAYCRLFLPEQLEPRDALRQAAEAGGFVILAPLHETA